MEIKFDARIAQTLIESMRIYCTSIQRDAKDILMLIDSGKEWNDPQFVKFREAIYQICSDLEKTLKLESDYLMTFQSKVDELRS